MYFETQGIKKKWLIQSFFLAWLLKLVLYNITYTSDNSLSILLAIFSDIELMVNSSYIVDNKSNIG